MLSARGADRALILEYTCVLGIFCTASRIHDLAVIDLRLKYIALTCEPGGIGEYGLLLATLVNDVKRECERGEAIIGGLRFVPAEHRCVPAVTESYGDLVVLLDHIGYVIRVEEHSFLVH